MSLECSYNGFEFFEFDGDIFADLIAGRCIAECNEDCNMDRSAECPSMFLVTFMPGGRRPMQQHATWIQRSRVRGDEHQHLAVHQISIAEQHVLDDIEDMNNMNKPRSRSSWS